MLLASSPGLQGEGKGRPGDEATVLYTQSTVAYYMRQLPLLSHCPGQRSYIKLLVMMNILFGHAALP